jgi:uncharacterized protein
MEFGLKLVEGESIVHPSVDLRRLAGGDGYGLFASSAIAAGSTIILWTCHNVVTFDQLLQERREVQENAIQLTDEYFSIGEREKADFLNHSCEPNCGVVGQMLITAMRDIMEDEELCIDYAMMDSKPICEFRCCCGSKNCRGNITCNDWKRLDLRLKYRGYFSSYIQSKINQLEVLEG